MDSITLPALPVDYEPTRATLHAYARAVGAIPRAHGIAHPLWWHTSLKVRPEGLATDPVPLPGGGALGARLDLRNHEIVVRAGDGTKHAVDMRSGATGTEMADQLIAVATDLGLEDRYERPRFENDEARVYDPAAAEAYFDAFMKAQTVLERHRVDLGFRTSPIQVWPHGFDLAFDWFGTKTVEHEGAAMPTQLNLGFYPGGDPYFYSNPWPFDEMLRETPLPHGAVWHTEGWKGSMLPYSAVQGDPEAAARIAEYARAVFDAAAPRLNAS